MSIRVAIAQINPKLGDLAANLALYEEKIRQGVKERADFLLFPELSLTGYYLRDTVPSVALTMKSPEMKTLGQLSRELPFVAGMVEESADHRFFNSAIYFEDGEVRHVHRKVYLPTYGMFDEQRYFARRRPGARLRFEIRPHGAADLRGSVASVDDLSGRAGRRARRCSVRRRARCAVSSTDRPRTTTRATGR